MTRRALPVLICALGLASLSCGTSGPSEARPIEILYYVSGGPDLSFEFVSESDPGCGSLGTGIQSPNANHQFGDRVFQTPHLFVLENARQPIRAVIRNTSLFPLQVDLFLGMTQAVGGDDGIVLPGECRTIASGVLTVTPNQRGPEIRTEVCSAVAGVHVPCLEQPPMPDRNIAFFGSTGDLAASTITNCLLNPFLDACRTPATFFWENPQDQYNAVMSVNAGQNPEGQPRAVIRTELYVNGNLRDSAGGTEPIVGVEI
jgi:hypothetical protein